MWLIRPSIMIVSISVFIGFIATSCLQLAFWKFLTWKTIFWSHLLFFQNQFHCQFCHFYLTKNLFWFSIFYDFHPKQEKQNDDTSSIHWPAHKINYVSFHLMCKCVSSKSGLYIREIPNITGGVLCSISRCVSLTHRSCLNTKNRVFYWEKKQSFDIHCQV